MAGYNHNYIYDYAEDYNDDEEYNFTAFGDSAAEKIREQKRAHLTKLEPEKKSAEELHAEHKSTLRRCISIVSLTLVIAAFFVINAYANSKCDTINNDISSLKTKIEEVNGENTELDMKLKNLASIEQVEKLAVEELGLVKLRQSDIEFVSHEGENKVLVSQNKASD